MPTEPTSLSTPTASSTASGEALLHDEGTWADTNERKMHRDGYVLNPLLNYKSVGIYAKLTHQKTEEKSFEEGTPTLQALLLSPLTHRRWWHL